MTSALAQRVLDYFDRQCAHFHALIGFLNTVPAALSGGDLEAIEAQHDAHVAAGDALNEECAALLAEWTAAGEVPAADGTAVRARAAEAHRLAAQAEAAYHEAAQALDAVSSGVRADQGRLRHGREMLHRYRLGEGGAAYIDRQA